LSKHQTNKQPSPAEQVAEAERVISELETKRQVLAEKSTEISEERKRLAYGAHAAFDAEASARLSDLRSAAIDAEQQLTELDAALSTARGKLEAARLAEAKAADREEALALRRATRQFVEAGRRVDHALALLAADGHALVDAHRQLARHGCQFPSSQQLESLGLICLRSAIMSTPWARTVDTVPPGQRARTFRMLTEGWAANIEANNIKPRLGEQTNNEAA
jgi:hypothetical protein